MLLHNMEGLAFVAFWPLLLACAGMACRATALTASACSGWDQPVLTL